VLTGTDADSPADMGIASLTFGGAHRGRRFAFCVDIADALDAFSRISLLERRRFLFSSAVRAGRAAADALPLMADVVAAHFPRNARSRARSASSCSQHTATIPTRSRRWLSRAASTGRRTATPRRRSRGRKHQGVDNGGFSKLSPVRLPPGNSTLIVVGDVGVGSGAALSNDFGKWQPAGTNRVSASPRRPFKAPRQLILVRHPERARVTILIGGVGRVELDVGFLPIQS